MKVSVSSDSRLREHSKRTLLKAALPATHIRCSCTNNVQINFSDSVLLSVQICVRPLNLPPPISGYDLKLHMNAICIVHFWSALIRIDRPSPAPARAFTALLGSIGQVQAEMPPHPIRSDRLSVQKAACFITPCKSGSAEKCHLG